MNQSVTGLDALFADAPKVLNPNEVADLLNISRPTVMRYIDQKRFPAYRIGDDGRWFIVRDELKQLMKANSNERFSPASALVNASSA